MSKINPFLNNIFFHQKGYDQLHSMLINNAVSSVFILVDENTQQYCLPHFLQGLQTDLPLEIIEIEAGEEHKTLETCTGIWNVLSELGADRKSVLINLGGGVITDLGGFVASLFKRGIGFVHVPTTLLAMVDAAIGGKNGANLGHLKNQIGTFNLPNLIVIDVDYLETLPQNQMKSGLAEMYKHGLVYRSTYWKKMNDLSQLTLNEMEELIRESVEIKTKVVLEDPNESGLRKILNFGHTLGHAIESYFLSNPNKTTLLHGEAVAVGMIMEAYLSSEIKNFPKETLENVKKIILHSFKKIDFQEADISPIMELLVHDKKNVHGKINFVLLNAVGKPEIDCQVENNLIRKAFEYYSSPG